MWVLIQVFNLFLNMGNDVLCLISAGTLLYIVVACPKKLDKTSDNSPAFSPNQRTPPPAACLVL